MTERMKPPPGSSEVAKLRAAIAARTGGEAVYCGIRFAQEMVAMSQTCLLI